MTIRPTTRTIARVACAVALACTGASRAADTAATATALYTLDCGHAWFKDFAVAADTGEFDHHGAELADPCFLIQHPRGWLLWDAGLPAQWPGAEGLSEQELWERQGVRVRAAPPLIGQLRAIGVSPQDVGLLAFSHLHFDHVGQAGLFKQATWIVNRAELEWANAEPPHFSIVPTLLAARDPARTQLIDGDHDVFGDGSVRILKAPGHTPGSSALLLRLPRAGAVILSGDLYITRASRAQRLVPVINADRAQTLASMARIERIAKNLKARLIVQHDPAVIAALPRRLD